ncbi:hypothetical protein NMY22_g611 [Coprinellus aureogranulatus]|nr:hypothetical protein NMY22_g611 [Coprinellus aureogranulatus]
MLLIRSLSITTMSYLSNAHNFTIGTFAVDAGTHVYSGGGHPRNPRDILYSNIAPGAIHDSEERCDAPKCHPDTRRAVQGDIISWIKHGDDCNILWLSGPAGAGKTAIAGSVAETCEREGLLAATFFFSSFLGSENRRYKRYLIPTLVYQLLQLDGFEAYEDQVLSAVSRNPAIFQKHLKGQMEGLILKPLRNLRRVGLSFPPAMAIIIDGVDEVEAPGSRQLDQRAAHLASEADQAEIVSALLQSACEPDLPFRFVVVSRPERVICEAFATAVPPPHAIILDSSYDPDSDIALFFKANFADLRRRYRLPSSWPTECSIKKLIQTASGQFVYAATIIRFLQMGEHPNPPVILQTLMDWQSQESAIAHAAMSSLDALYTRILQTSPNPALVAKWLGGIERLENTPSWLIRELFQDYEGQAEYLMEGLASVVYIPAPEDTKSPYKSYHKSLHDFLFSGRCDQELHDAYCKGRSTFYQPSCAEVFMGRRTNISMTGPKWQAFQRAFFELISKHYVAPYSRSLRDELSGCDVVWWVKAIITTFPAEPELAIGCISRLFATVHHHCFYNVPVSEIRTPDVCQCEASCKHWRGNILRACRAFGWRTPDAIVLLREKMYDNGNWANDCWITEEWDFRDSFSAPFNQGGSEMVIPEGHRFPHTIYTVDHEYESLCKLVDTMFSRLPENWKSEYLEQLGYSGNPQRCNALPHHIDRIKRNLEEEPKT